MDECQLLGKVYLGVIAVFDELREEVLRKLKSGNKPTGIYDLLIQYKQAGMDKDTMYNVLESIRAEMREIGEEELEDEIMDNMDCVDGWCYPTWRIYPEMFGWQPVMLSVKDLKRIKNKFDISFDSYAGGLIGISVVNSSHKCEAPCYWYLTKGCGMRPVVVVVDIHNGMIVTAFVTKIKMLKSFEFLDNSQNRDVIIDRSVFSKVNDCICVVKGYSMFKHEGNLVCLFEEEQEPVKSYRNGRFDLLVDNCNQIVGFSICDLTEDEIMMIDRLEEG